MLKSKTMTLMWQSALHSRPSPRSSIKAIIGLRVIVRACLKSFKLLGLFGNIHTQNTRFLKTVNRLFPTSHFLHSDNIRLHSIHLSSPYIVSNLFVIRYLLHMISRCHVLVLDFTCYLLKTTTHNTFKSNQPKRN